MFKYICVFTATYFIYYNIIQRDVTYKNQIVIFVLINYAAVASCILVTFTTIYILHRYNFKLNLT